MTTLGTKVITVCCTYVCAAGRAMVWACPGCGKLHQVAADEPQG